MADMKADNMAREMTRRSGRQRLRSKLSGMRTPSAINIDACVAVTNKPAERRCWRWPNCTKNGEMANTGTFSDLLRHKLAQEG